ncbi:endonuclease/exonuclease/phosphatase family protein [Clavibacter zhangzhiyongii]|uniref:endonuclease/exonuclease/phosphatase family protein n=1 Tax=Clavibacter zhangzhiyongii TaxID=2768071 RepID=UPI00195E8FA3|nr:endonuclease/exonuclease/phosphatase family protein [Clavibacter zhangzhiyongii]MBM7026528.1 endonuclease/exonuclease/phosphatase family protein [Clavibacter zhangzhiyongii]
MTLAIGPTTGDDLHLISLNVRMPWHGTRPGEADHWPERQEVLTRFLQQERPTVLGVQEALWPQVQAIEKALPPSYRMVGQGREGGSHGEHGAIFYQASRLTLLEHDVMWLSDTPDVIGSMTWGNPMPRILTWARFQDEATGHPLVVLVTHLDHDVAEARDRAAEAIAELVRTRFAGMPLVLMGDFNAPVDSFPYDVLTRRAGLRDSWLDTARPGQPRVRHVPRLPATGGRRPAHRLDPRGRPRRRARRRGQRLLLARPHDERPPARAGARAAELTPSVTRPAPAPPPRSLGG